MSRVEDALRRAASAGPGAPRERAAETGPADPEPIVFAMPSADPGVEDYASAQPLPALTDDLFAHARCVPYSPAPESHLLDITRPHETPAEEFRTLRTRLNHLQTLQPLHTVVVTSPSPAEGKTFSAVNLALAEAQLPEGRVLLGDFDLRRPAIHTLLQIDRAPGVSDYISGQCSFADAVRRIEGLNLYVMPAGSPVKNPLELLNARRAKGLFEELPRYFNWAIFDTPPLLFSADANLLSSMADGSVLVVKIGSTTFDNLARALQSLSDNNVLGVVANGARASELYSKYTYYYSKAE
jgi:receptor protein-tyrosine kinase